MEGKDLFLKYAKLVDKMKGEKSDTGILITPEEAKIIENIMSAFADNPRYSILIQNILKAPQGSREIFVEKFFSEEKVAGNDSHDGELTDMINSTSENKTEEKGISMVYKSNDNSGFLVNAAFVLVAVGLIAVVMILFAVFS